MAVVLFLPLGYSVLKELLELQGAGILIGRAEDHIRHVAQLVEHMEDVVVVQLPQRGIADAEELIAHVESCSSRMIRRWLRQACVVDVVGGPPGEVGPMRADLKYVVIVIEIEVDDEALLRG